MANKARWRCAPRRSISSRRDVIPSSQPNCPQRGARLPSVIRRRRLLGNVVRYEVACGELLLNVDVLNRSARHLLDDQDRVVVHADLDEVQEIET